MVNIAILPHYKDVQSIIIIIIKFKMSLIVFHWTIKNVTRTMAKFVISQTEYYLGVIHKIIQINALLKMD
jgi:hypothetical protein